MMVAGMVAESGQLNYSLELLENAVESYRCLERLCYDTWTFRKSAGDDSRRLCSQLGVLLAGYRQGPDRVLDKNPGGQQQKDPDFYNLVVCPC